MSTASTTQHWPGSEEDLRGPQRSSPRKIERLSSASFVTRPEFIPQAKRLTGARRAGMGYEKKVVRELRSRNLGDVVHHQWIMFTDANNLRPAYAEPEGWIEFKSFVLLFECKLTGGPYGKEQMEGFYKPLIEHLFKKPVRSLLICKHLNPGTPGPFYGSPEEFLQSAETFGTWHWLPS